MLRPTIAFCVFLTFSSGFWGETAWATLGPPGTWGDPCQDLQISDEDASEVEPQKAFEMGTRLFLPPGWSKSRWWEDCATLDRSRAIRLFKIAGQAKHVGAANQLGFMYKTGGDVEPDFIEAEKWYAVAAKPGRYFGHPGLGRNSF